MPIYEYQCSACGHRLEKLQKLSDALLTDCPACAEPHLKKMVSASAFRLKGGGWYETDFKTGNKKNVDGAGSTGSGDSSSSAGSADTRPADSKASDGKAAESKPTAKTETKSASAK